MTKKFELKNGSCFVIAETPGGVYNCDQIRRICDIAEDDSAFLKITEDQRIGFILTPENYPTAQKKLAKYGVTLSNYRQERVPGVKSCLGELCPKFEQDALGDCIELSNYLLNKYPTPKPSVTMGMNGCSEGCASSSTDDIHIIGESTGYKIYLGGRSKELPQTAQFVAENITKEQLPEIVSKILEVFYLNREANETISDLCERIGLGIFSALFENSSSTFEEESDLTSEQVESLTENEEFTENDLGADDLVEMPTNNEDIIEDISEKITENIPDTFKSENTEDELDISEDDLKNIVNSELETDEKFEDQLPDSLNDISPSELDDTKDLSASDEYLEDNELSDIKLDDSEFSNNQEDNMEENVSFDFEEDLDLSSIQAKASPEDLAIQSEDSTEKFIPPEGIKATQMYDETEGTLDLVDATDEDVARITSTIRAEKENTNNPIPLTGEEDYTDNCMPEASDEEEMELDAQIPPAKSQLNVAQISSKQSVNSKPHTTPPPAKTEPAAGRFKMSVTSDEIRLVLPGEIECNIPFDWITEDSAFEMDIAEQTLSIEQKTANLYQVKYGSISMCLPKPKVKAA